MWTINTENNKWYGNKDFVTKQDFEYLKETLDSVRFYSKCLSGATYFPANNLDNIYDVLGSYIPRNWYVSSSYSITSFPSESPRPINLTTSNEYYNKYVEEYGLTLKNMFTPKRLIDDSIDNFIYVDVCTTEEIVNIAQSTIGMVIDGIRIKEGHRVLIKDQKTFVNLLNSVDPNSYFFPTPYYKDLNQADGSLDTKYYYFNEDNGIYICKNNKLIRESDLDVYNDCVRYSIFVKLGTNKDKQFHLSRMLNGYYSTTSENNPIEFIEKHNWIIRNRVDYNNVLDLNYYDSLKHDTQLYYDIVTNATYSIPARYIGVGEFGGIINFQNNISHIINNKYKVNLRSIDEVNGFYWICGDEGTILKVSKVTFKVQKIDIGVIGSLKSISFFNDLRGVVVGDFNTIYYTDNGGKNWSPINITSFSSFSYNKVLYYDIDSIFIAGNSGVLLDLTYIINEWSINRKRVAKYLNDEEYLLVEDIMDIIPYKSNTWGLSYSYSTQSIPSNKECLMMVTNNNNIIVYNLNNFVSYDFLYLDFQYEYGDINSVLNKSYTSEFYFSSNIINSISGIYSFDINNFSTLNGSSSNVIYGATGATLSYNNIYVNNINDFNGSEILVCGNNSLLDFATYSAPIDNILDPTFNSRLKSKLLFLDYDIAGKLNFFNDQQNYRMPNSLTFSGASFSASSYINFDVLPISASSSETNWLTYWKDREKTFEYNSSILTPVLSSSTFSYSTYSTFGSYTSSQITKSLSSIINLAPDINDIEHSRYIGTSSISSPSSSFDIYLYNYLMVVRTSNINKSDVGDMVYFDSDIAEGTFTINKVFTSGSYSYHYMFTDFNENILTNLTTMTSSVILTNINKYTSVVDLSTKFGVHPVSDAYDFSYSTYSGVVTIGNVFNKKSAYYNLGTEVDLSGVTYSMRYEDTFLKFGYKPNYNILDYLENINPKLNQSKELLAMPNYYFIPCKDYPFTPGFSGLTANNIFLDTGLGFIGGSGSFWLNPSTPPENKLVFGENLKFEWDSLFINTYVDIKLYELTGSASYTTEKLLITNKYKSNFSGQVGYVIEFQKPIIYNMGINVKSISITSRRFLYQISDDLQELNNIQRPSSLVSAIGTGIPSEYSNYESELNFKFPTDSYAKILLSDVDILTSLSGIIYVDYKNELAMNITRLDKQVEIKISSTSNYSTIVGSSSVNYLYISCLEKHGLVDGDGVLLEFTGGTNSSQTLNPEYYGFHTVGTFPGDEYNFFVHTLFGLPSIVSGDPGVARYTRKDPFFNYQPVDLIDLGVDKKTKISVDIRPDNVELDGSIYKLVNLDTKKYKFKLFDGLTLDIINSLYPWLLEAEISDAYLGMDSNQNLIWYKGIWYCGRWFGSSNGKISTWVSGIWISGDWYGGIWKSNSIEDKLININIQNVSNNTNSIWYDGRWYDGTWEAGTWYNGRRYAGTWKSGDWYNGIWNDGIWNDGKFIGGIWVLGTWLNGIFNTDNKPSYWIDGKWNGGDFENGIWYDGVWDQKNNKVSRFGVKSYNSRTSTWHAGKWISGDFHSRMNINDLGLPDVSDTHKLSTWRTGVWSSGNWYGGVAYNMDFRSGVWAGGILEDIQVVGIDTTLNTMELNGIFKFNIGDDITLIDNNVGGSFSVFGNNDNPLTYKVLYTIDDDITKLTTIYVDKDLSLLGNYSISGFNLNLRVVSRFKNTDWQSGIWTNGIFEDGSWNGGIWYNGVFNANWG